MVRRDDSFGYFFQGDVDYKYSRESRTGISFYESREKVINRSVPMRSEALSAVCREKPNNDIEHSRRVFLVLLTAELSRCQDTK